ncbi:hypothetical protein CYY_000008 [Polysphondylium violaceum]|uniref:CRAL-TRIO domain-containing protein n=1 Tax=Polysphondylium violaceum TaxID=133409 RepID=A0A8J4Q4M4_9MYCE|nr:hypothetical protein CYY_000008 [Polysphondylium violaceum]
MLNITPDIIPDSPKSYRILNGLSQEEQLKLEEFRNEQIAKDIEPQYLMLYLFAKKLIVADAAKLLENNLNLRKKLDIPFPVLKKDVNSEIALKASSFSIIGKRDKLNRSISYLIPHNLVPKDHDFKEYLTSILWNIDQSVNDDSSSHRLGMVIVEDLKNFSLFKHFDKRLSQHVEGKMENVFPGRIQKIYILNPPFYVKPMLSFAKTFVKNKIVKRVEIVKQERLLQDIDSDQLLPHFGGSYGTSYSQYFDSLPHDF